MCLPAGKRRTAQEGPAMLGWDSLAPTLLHLQVLVEEGQAAGAAAAHRREVTRCGQRAGRASPARMAGGRGGATEIRARYNRSWEGKLERNWQEQAGGRRTLPAAPACLSGPPVLTTAEC